MATPFATGSVTRISFRKPEAARFPTTPVRITTIAVIAAFPPSISDSGMLMAVDTDFGISVTNSAWFSPQINASTATLPMLAINPWRLALLFLVGCLMDTIPSILILAPILVPVGVQFGLDELHLGVLFCITLTVGFITPPFGINLFTAVSTTGESYTSVVKGVIPFMIVMIICVLICAFVAPIITFLPGFMMGT